MVTKEVFMVVDFELDLFFFFFFFLCRAASMAYGSSQARGQIGTVATGGI